MNIKWYGQACFRIMTNEGISIVMDPFDESTGYRFPKGSANIVTVSHDHSDHNNVQSVTGDFDCINNAGVFTSNKINIIGVETFHDDSNGSKRGKNIIFKLNIDGISICHCGDLGHILTQAQADLIGKVDVLLIPVGGVFTIDAIEAVKVIEQLNPAVIIPMHYQTKYLTPKILFSEVHEFTSLYENKYMELEEIELNAKTINKYKGIVVLNVQGQ